MPLSWPTSLPTSGPIRLRRHTEDDLGLIEQLAQDPYLPTIGTVPAVYTEAEGRAYLARQEQRLRDGTGFSMVVARRSDDLGVGTAGLWLQDLGEGRASAGYSTAPAHRGHGYATAALRALCTLAWQLPPELGAIERVELLIEPWNTASIRVAEHVGFVREALLPRHTEIGRRRRDMLRYVSRRERIETCGSPPGT